MKDIPLHGTFKVTERTRSLGGSFLDPENVYRKTGPRKVGIVMVVGANNTATLLQTGVPTGYLEVVQVPDPSARKFKDLSPRLQPQGILCDGRRHARPRRVRR